MHKRRLFLLCSIAIMVIGIWSGALSYTTARLQADAGTLSVDTSIETELPALQVQKYVIQEVPVEVEFETVIEKSVYTFPFEVEELGVFTVERKCTCKECNVEQVHEFKTRNDVVVLANPEVIPSGTLIWVENVGIRQVQPITNETQSLYIMYPKHTDTEVEPIEVMVFEIKE